MPTRRQTAVGLGSMALGSAVVSSASFLSGVTAAADLRVVVSSELSLTPGRVGEEYVQTDAEGEVEAIVIKRLNQRAITRFEDLIEVTNNGNVPYDRITLAFSATGEDPDASSVAVAETLDAVSGDEPTETDAQGRTTVLADADRTFDSGDTVAFGMEVNLLPGDSPGDLEELPAESNVTLSVTAIDDE